MGSPKKIRFSDALSLRVFIVRRSRVNRGNVSWPQFYAMRRSRLVTNSELDSELGLEGHRRWTDAGDAVELGSSEAVRGR